MNSTINDSRFPYTLSLIHTRYTHAHGHIDRNKVKKNTLKRCSLEEKRRNEIYAERTRQIAIFELGFFADMIC